MSAPSYQQYVSSVRTSGRDDSIVPEYLWNQMSDREKWNQTQGGITLNTDAPGHSELASQLGTNDALMGIPGGSGFLNIKDPSRAISSGGIDYSPASNFKVPEDPAMWAGIIGLPLAGAALGATGALGNLGEAGIGAVGSSNPGYWSMMADSGQLASDASPGLSALGESGPSVFTPGMEATGAAESNAINAGLVPSAGLGAAGRGGASMLSQIASNPGQWIADHPLDAARMGLGLGTLGAAAFANKPSGSSGMPNAGDVRSIIDQMANANRVDQTTPLGSRHWTQDANGRWAVTDSMDPAEEANFRNVQGMNADVTGMARQRLAELLASPRHERVDAPLNIRFGG